MVKKLKTMSELPYHYGMRLKMFPSDAQKKIIRQNSDASRFVYNELVGCNNRILQSKKIISYMTWTESLSSRLSWFWSRQHYLWSLSKRGFKTVPNNDYGAFNADHPLIIIKQQLMIESIRKHIKTQRSISEPYPWLRKKAIDSGARGTAMRSYQAAWNLFRKVHTSGVPKFHHKSYEEHYQSSNTYPSSVPHDLHSGNIHFLDAKHIHLPKLGRIKVTHADHYINQFQGDVRIGTITVKKDVRNQYWVSMQLGSEKPFVTKLKPSKKLVGIDLNTENFLTTSAGQVVNNPRYYRKQLNKLTKSQHILSRKYRRAKAENRPLRTAINYQKQRMRMSRLTNKIRRKRNAFLNDISKQLILKNQTIVAEELRSRNMLKNHALAMSITDAGWRTFIQMLTYKADLYGRKFITVDPSNTTQTCSNCGFIMGTGKTDKLTLRQRKWVCPQCGVHHIRDKNAAVNILKKGMLADEK